MAWQPLKKGDVVEIVAPSFSVTKEEIKKVEAYVRSLGLKPRVPKDLVKEDLFFSNSDKYRLKHLYNALKSKDAKAVWCIRGGYGAARLLPKLKKMKKPKREKLLIGFSDITALHIFLSQSWGWQTLHGSVLTPITRGVVSKETLKRLEGIIFGKVKKTELKGLKPLNKAAQTKKTIKAELTGGNLTLVQTSIGTVWEIKAKGKILLIEEVDERPYRVDRLINHLAQAGALKGVAAIIFGTFGNEETDKQTLSDTDKVLKRFAEEHPKIPMLKSEKFGHALDNYPLPIHTAATLKLGSKPTLEAKTGAK